MFKKECTLEFVNISLVYFRSKGGVVQHIEVEESKRTLIDKLNKITETESSSSSTIIINPLDQGLELCEKHSKLSLRMRGSGRSLIFQKI